MARQEDQRREQILDAVARCVEERGIDGATMRLIAERANVSTGMLTYYYANKQELINAAIARARTHFAERMAETVGTEPNPRRLEALFKLMLTERDEGTGSWGFWIEYFAEATREPGLGTRDGGFFAGARESWVSSVRAGMEEGYFADDIDPLLVAELLGSLLIGLGIHTTLDPQNVPPEYALKVANMVIS